jgi:hypothetical protein
MVNNEVVGNSHDPGDEFSVILVLSSFDRLDHFHESILKKIFGKRLIAYIQADIRKNFILMTVD